MDRRRFVQALSAAAAAWPMLGRAQQPSLRVGMANANMTVAYPYISSPLGLGMFKEEGVDVEVVHGQNSNQILGLLAGGAVDLVYCNPEPVIQLVAHRGANIKSVFVVQVS